MSSLGSLESSYCHLGAKCFVWFGWGWNKPPTVSKMIRVGERLKQGQGLCKGSLYERSLMFPQNQAAALSLPTGMMEEDPPWSSFALVLVSKPPLWLASYVRGRLKMQWGAGFKSLRRGVPQPRFTLQWVRKTHRDFHWKRNLLHSSVISLGVSLSRESLHGIVILFCFVLGKR
jgi:hypothetical protein